MSEEATPASPKAAGEAKPDTAATHHPRTPEALVDFMARDWDRSPQLPTRAHLAVADFERRRRDLARRFPGTNLVIPVGVPKVRANDTDYRFRPGSDFYWLTGHTEAGCVLLLSASADGHRATLYVEPRADRSTPAFFTNARTGELWVGPRRGVAETASISASSARRWAIWKRT